MELRQLQFFVACAQAQSFSQASAALFTTQSNVSKTIASLESELGKKLFDRKQHGIVLTEKGKQIYKYALNMLECNAQILACAQTNDTDELRVSFQPSSWFASAFCEYYIQYGGNGQSYRVISAALYEIIQRLSGGVDQLGFAYVEEKQLERLRDMFQVNHINYIVLKETRTVLYYSGKNGEIPEEDIPLIQGCEDEYASLAVPAKLDGEKKKRFHVAITTNSDYIMQGILQQTKIGNISPEYMSCCEKVLSSHTIPLGDEEKKLFYICMFRNDRLMEKQAKHFLTFLKQYLKK